MLEEGRLDPADLPACYRWAVFNDAGDVMASDLGNGETAEAWRTLREGASVVRYDGAAGAVRQVSAALPDGLTCVLQYDYLPDFVSKELRDALPDPQAIMTVALIASLVAAVALIAVRAARVISAKMRPLSEAAERIGRQDLDFSVGSTDVREVNEVLGGMERMRAALAESLREGWAADEARRREVAALAHDLKTPLAVARWNAELLAEGPLDAAQAESAAQVAESVDRMEGYVRLLVEASQACAAGNASGTVDAAALSAQVERQARQLCAAAGCSLAFEGASAGLLAGNGPQLVRAIMNLVSNAAEHAPAGSAVRVRLHVSGGDATDGDASDGVLRVEVADEGPGFSEAALVHGAERFFTGSPDRNAESGHFGLGLSIASDVAAAHGGTRGRRPLRHRASPGRIRARVRPGRSPSRPSRPPASLGLAARSRRFTRVRLLPHLTVAGKGFVVAADGLFEVRGVADGRNRQGNQVDGCKAHPCPHAHLGRNPLAEPCAQRKHRQAQQPPPPVHRRSLQGTRVV